MTDYAELHAHSAFSFLDGANHPEEMAAEAVRLGLSALAITDHDGLYGVVRFAQAAREVGLPTVFGAELHLPGPDGVLDGHRPAPWQNRRHDSMRSCGCPLPNHSTTRASDMFAKCCSKRAAASGAIIRRSVVSVGASIIPSRAARGGLVKAAVIMRWTIFEKRSRS